MLLPTALLLSACGDGGHSADGSGSLSLSLAWTAPQFNTDGTALSPTAIGGYRVYYGTDPNNLTSSISVASNDTIVTGLAAGTYYFSVTAIDSTGIESAKSSLAIGTVP